MESAGSMFEFQTWPSLPGTDTSLHPEKHQNWNVPAHAFFLLNLVLPLGHDVDDWVDPDWGPVEHVGDCVHSGVQVAFVKDLVNNQHFQYVGDIYEQWVVRLLDNESEGGITILTMKPGM